MNIRIMQKTAFEIARANGWHEEKNPFMQSAALIHSEVSEAVEAFRCGDPDDIIEELADVVIRVADTCEENGWDLQEAILAKMDANRSRAYRHGGKRC